MNTSLSILDLFYPQLCVCCSQPLLDQENILCLSCRFDLPFVDNGSYTTNVLTRIFEGRISLEFGASFLYYHPKGRVKKLIHELKYKGHQEIGIFLANWFGSELQKAANVSQFDCIIPVPLHRKKLKSRGYNQLTKFGKRLAEIFQTAYKENQLERVSFTKTQTKKKRVDRFQNTDAKFILSENHNLKNQHVLLIDDVVTTGATLESCYKELEKGQVSEISILTIAITE